LTADRFVLRQFEIASPFAPQTSSLDRPGKALRLLGRYRGHPVGWVNVPTEGSATIDDSRIRHLITEQLGWDLAGFTFPAPDAPLEAPAVAAPISVVVCTRDRPQDLERCLQALLALDYPDFEVLVVDNASRNDETATVAARLGVRSVREDRPGLDWARNRGIAETRHSIIAFVDDDARPDSLWLAAIACAFVDPEVDAMTGLVAPLELETFAQQLFELTYGGMGKGFAPRTFHRDRNTDAELIGIQAVGVGTNMAFRREVFERVGLFDTALDVGTPARGGGDLDMFHRVVASGRTLLYQPAALVWHRHRRGMDELERQLGDDGCAFTVYLINLWRKRTVPRRAVLSFALRRWVPWLLKRFIRGLFGRGVLPLPLLWAPVRGLIAAPQAAWNAAHRDHQLRRHEPTMEARSNG
jgi:glycosyltransferase involved in cell wall biosynthesis